jgi:hypothetical protein
MNHSMHTQNIGGANPDSTSSRRKSSHDRTPVANHQILAGVVLLCVMLLQNVSALADPATIIGRWRLDTTASVDPADELKGIRASKRKKKNPSVAAGSEAGPLGETQRRYWEQANAGEEWKHSQELAHAGPVQRILESENLEIVPADNGYIFIYADGYERGVIPNPNGRVFTASGEELAETDIGFTLAFWKKDTLILETRITRGGKLNEQITTSEDGDRLTVNIVIDRRDWKWIAKLDRVFDRAAADGFQENSK